MKPRIIFAGTPDFAAVHLKALLEAQYNIVAVYTQPDRKAGRGHKLTPSPVKQLALEHNIEVFTPLNFKEESDLAQFEQHNADLAIVVAYGLLLPQRVLDAPRLGCINIHASLLPKWRGAAPIQRSLLSGEKVTGVSIMQIVKELDAGDVLCTKELEILDTDTSLTLFERLADCGSKALVENLDAILEEKITATPQDPSLVTYAAKLSKEESPLDFNLSAQELALKVRGLNPWPIATTSLDNVVYKIFEAEALNQEDSEQTLLSFDGKQLANGSILGVIDKHFSINGLAVKCNDGVLVIKTLQAPGKGKSNATDYARSKKDIFKRGVVLG